MATTTEVKRPRRKRCGDCGELFPADEILDGVCEDCDGHYTYCSICDERQHEDDACRHVFSCEASCWEWCGAGSHEGDWSYHKASFLAVLDKTGLAVELREAIEADTLSTTYLSGYIGSPHYICHAGGGDRRGSYGDRFTDGLTTELEETMTLGVGWAGLDPVRQVAGPRPGADPDGRLDRRMARRAHAAARGRVRPGDHRLPRAEGVRGGPVDLSALQGAVADRRRGRTDPMTTDPFPGDLSDPMTWDDRWPRLHRPEAPRRRDPGRAARWIVVAVLALAWAYCWKGWQRAVLERDEAHKLEARAERIAR
jgi:hypothetical protein